MSKKRKFKDCKIQSMKRATGDWVATIQSPIIGEEHISVLGEGLTKVEAVADATVKWNKHYK